MNIEIMLRRTLIIFFTFLVCTGGKGQTTAPKYSNEFLNIGVGARALGMSGTQVSNVQDVTAAYWNPAGLMNIEDQYQVAAMHSEYFAGIAKYDYAGFATPVDSNSHLGISVIRFAIDNIPNTLNLIDDNGVINYDRITRFSIADYAFLITYARRMDVLDGLKVGGNAKVIYRNVGPFASAWGFGLDAGAQLDYNDWHFGAMARDVTSTFNAWTFNTETFRETFIKTGNRIPQNSLEITLPRLILGASRGFDIGDRFGVLAGINADMTFDGKRNVPVSTSVLSIDPHMGVELDYKELVYLRGGIGNIQEIKGFDGDTYTSVQPNFGVGLSINRFTIDYALTDVGNQSEALYSHVFSLKVGFDNL